MELLQPAARTLLRCSAAVHRDAPTVLLSQVPLPLPQACAMLGRAPALLLYTALAPCHQSLRLPRVRPLRARRLRARRLRARRVRARRL